MDKDDDQRQEGAELHTIFLVELLLEVQLVRFPIMPGNPESSDAGPKRTRKFRKRMEEAVMHNLVDHQKDKVATYTE